MTKSTIILIGGIAIAGMSTSLVILHQARTKLRENDAALRQQDNQLAELATEHRRLSNLVAQANSSPAGDQTAELATLRGEAATLRKQTNELGKQLEENRRSRPAQTASRSDSSTRFIGGVSVVSDSNSEEYRKQLDRMTYDKMGDVRNLSSAVRKYGRDHQGEFPTNFDQAAPYLYEIQAQANKIHEEFRKLDPSAPPKEVALPDLITGERELDASAPPKQAESPRTSEFEMVYQGSYKELTNVPWQEVALIRERQAWPTPSGKWARIYVAASGEIEIVESDDNFQAWEWEHIIPPPAAGQ